MSSGHVSCLSISQKLRGHPRLITQVLDNGLVSVSDGPRQRLAIELICSLIKYCTESTKLTDKAIRHKFRYKDCWPWGAGEGG